jgi:hypothetical protein
VEQGVHAAVSALTTPLRRTPQPAPSRIPRCRSRRQRGFLLWLAGGTLVTTAGLSYMTDLEHHPHATQPKMLLWVVLLLFVGAGVAALLLELLYGIPIMPAPG